MAAVKSRDTTPEVLVRRLTCRLGYRFRLYRRDLPGTPDIVLPALRKIINVHGCFWHGHACAHGRRKPDANANYWRRKIGRNKARDARTLAALRRAGWRVLVIWECQTAPAEIESLRLRLRRFLRARR